MQVLRDEEINGIEVYLGSCDDVEHWLSSVSVGSKNMAPTEAVKDLDKTLGSTVDSIADLALDPHSTEKTTPFPLGTGVKIADKRVDDTQADIDQLYQNITNMQANMYPILQEQARLIKDQGDTIEALKKHNNLPATGATALSTDAATLDALTQAVQTLHDRVTAIELTVNKAVLFGDQQGQSDISVAANSIKMQDRERKNFNKCLDETLRDCARDHGAIKRSLDGFLAV